MKTKKLNREELFDFIVNESKVIKNYKFDVFHDISKIMRFAYDKDNLSNHEEKVSAIYVWQLREGGSYLWNVDDLENIEHSRKVFSIEKEYIIQINANCDYLLRIPFAEITNIKPINTP